MPNKLLKVPKIQKQVVLWVHPEGRVQGSLFLHAHSRQHAGEEEPIEVLNKNEAFLVLHRQEPDELRFYNRASIVRVEYQADDRTTLPDIKPLRCQLELMDGSMIRGTIKESMPPDRLRLFDYINKKDTRFLKLHLEMQAVCLINKSYIIYATNLEEEAD